VYVKTVIKIVVHLVQLYKNQSLDSPGW